MMDKMAVRRPQDVRWDFSDFSLRFGAPRLRVDGVERTLEWQPVPGFDGLAAFEAVEASGRWRWELTACVNADGVPGCRVCCFGQLAQPAREVELDVLTLPTVAARRVLAQGMSMGGCASFATAGTERRFEGHYQLLLVNAGRVLQLTVPQRQAQLTFFTGHTADGLVRDLTARVHLLHWGERQVAAVPVELYSGADGFALMEAYARAHRTADKRYPTDPVIGWNSWDYYRWTITEAEVLKNAAFIARDPVLSKRIKRIIIDDGWTYCYGEWDANPLFPSGMAALAKELTAMGFEPGLWFAPAIVEPQARIAQWDPDMLAHGESDWPCLSYECMQRVGFILDPTVAKSRRFLHELFDRYAVMGYRYFKLDFLAAALSARKFADPTMPRCDIVRRLVEPIHAAVAGRAEILGCNYPFHTGGTPVDAVRVANDIHARWDSLRSNTVSVAARFWTNRCWWLNDPDFAVCRSSDTSDDPDLRRLLACLVYVTADGDCREETPDFRLVGDNMNRAQIEILLSVVLCAAGAINFSDDLTRLNSAGIELMHKVVLAEPGDTARPLDLFEHDLPERWLQSIPGGQRLLLINWEDSPRDVTHSFGQPDGSVTDFWHDTAIPVNHAGSVTVTIPPRSCRFLQSQHNI